MGNSVGHYAAEAATFIGALRFAPSCSIVYKYK